MKRLAFLLILSMAGPPREYEFHYDFVLGTSLDLYVRALDRASAQKCEAAVLAEIDRLNAVMSTYDPNSEISRLNATRGEMRCSPELFELLKQCEAWRIKSNGIFNPYLGQVIETWSRANKAGRLPDSKVLEAFAEQMKRPGLELDPERRTARRLDDRPIHVDAIATGLILNYAIAAAKVPGVTAALIDIGGDMMSFGDWTVGIADPRHDEDNVAPMQTIGLKNMAVTTSGATRRFYEIGGRRYSRILDPRTCRPAEGILSAVAASPDGTTADVLATILCVLKPEEGLALTAKIPGAECLIIDAAGNQFASPGWAAQDKPMEKNASDWPDKYQLTIDITLKNQQGRRYRPYTAFWIVDEDGKAVRTIAVWGNERKYLRSLSQWWAIAKDLPDMVKAVTRASRGGGKYTLAWDGLDDDGKPVPQGTYTLRIEVNRDKGSHIKDMSCKIDCKDKPAKGSIDGNAEVDSVKVTYGPKP
jgi:thiamine biosynthesis lipoprotein ApbE